MGRTPRLALALLTLSPTLETTRAPAAPPSGGGGSARLRAGAATSSITPWMALSINGGMTDRTVTPGGYEPWRARSSYLETGASPKIVETLSGLLEEVASAGSR